MNRLALLNPTSLVGKEIKEALEKRRELWSDIRLLTLETGKFGLLSEVAGEATVVQELNADSLEGVDLVFAPPDPGDDLGELLAALAGAPCSIIVSPATTLQGIPIVVAGVNLEAVDTQRRPLQLVSPHAGTIALAHLLQPLRALGLKEAVASVVQPASIHGQTGIDELLEQTRGVLSFSSDFSQDVFGGQLALNLVQAGSDDDISGAVSQAIGAEVSLAVQLLQGAVFHSVSASVFVRCDAGISASDIDQALESSPYIEMERETKTVGPIDASGRSTLLTVPARAQEGDRGGFWLWAVMDNLILGASGNALAMAEAITATRQ